MKATNHPADKSSAAKSKSQSTGPAPDMEMANSALHRLFLDSLRDIYWAEKHLVKNLPKMAKKATSKELKAAIENHLQETEGHVNRLEEVFKSLNERVSAKKCEAMAGLVQEADETTGDTENGTLVRDVAIISCAQKIEHYEIATYGTLRTLATVMGHTNAVNLLASTLEEEKNADRTLSEIAESFVNKNASREMK